MLKVTGLIKPTAVSLYHIINYKKVIMEIMVKFELLAQEEQTENIKQFFETILQDTRDYEGCNGAQVGRLEKEPNKIVLTEYWKSNEHFQKYLEWRKNIGDFETLGNMLSTNPDIQIFELITTA
ncbi:antibiotic biosynthesis monooxygenase family protein [uncultured Croceitalea sp.]|uniref:putative quinol monooxygenase n=1 Tax=uncultured Croceitalea sp. TaxID=1798908 RepID=UPI003305E1A3